MLALRVEGGVVAAYFRDGQVKRHTALQLRRVMGVSDFEGMTLVVPEGTTIITTNALQDLGFEHVILPPSLRWLEAYSFHLNLSLVNVVVPANCEVSTGVFKKCCSLKQVKIGPCQIIGANAFEGCSSLERVCLVGVRQIMTGAFSGCSSLASLSLPDTVDTIGPHAFQRTAIESFVFPPMVKIAPSSCFFCARQLKGVDLCNVEVIEPSAFSQTQLLYVCIPGTVQCIHASAFAGSALKRVSFQESDTPLRIKGANAFASTSLRTVVLPLRLRHQHAESGTFGNCLELERIEFHTQARYDVGSAFCLNCTKLRVVVLPRRLEHLYPRAFEGCTSLSEINLGETNLNSIRLRAFSGCRSLRDVRLPETLQEVESEAFCDSGVHRVTGGGPNGLRIGTRAFFGCKWLYTAVFNYSGVLLKVAPHSVRRLVNQFEGCTRLQTLLMPNYQLSEEKFRARLPTLSLYARPSVNTLRAAEKLHAEWWRQMFLLDPDHRRSAYHILWVIRQCGLPHLVAVKILRELRPFDLEQVRHV